MIIKLKSIFFRHGWAVISAIFICIAFSLKHDSAATSAIGTAILKSNNASSPRQAPPLEKTEPNLITTAPITKDKEIGEAARKMVALKRVQGVMLLISKELGLSQEESSAVESLLVGQDFPYERLSFALGANTPEWRKEAMIQQITEEIAQRATQDVAQRFKTYVTEKPVRDFVTDLASKSIFSGQPLDLTQTRALQEIITSSYSEGEPSALVDLNLVKWTEVEHSARNILTPKQFDLFSAKLAIVKYSQAYEAITGHRAAASVPGY